MYRATVRRREELRAWLLGAAPSPVAAWGALASASITPRKGSKVPSLPPRRPQDVLALSRVILCVGPLTSKYPEKLLQATWVANPWEVAGPSRGYQGASPWALPQKATWRFPSCALSNTGDESYPTLVWHPSFQMRELSTSPWVARSRHLATPFGLVRSLCRFLLSGRDIKGGCSLCRARREEAPRSWERRASSHLARGRPPTWRRHPCLRQPAACARS